MTSVTMKKELKKRIFKKNQIIITALALMIAIAGYLNFAGREITPESSKALSDAAQEDSQLMDLSQEDIEAQNVLDAEEGTDILAANEEEGDELPVADESGNAAAETEQPAGTTEETAGEAQTDSEELSSQIEQSGETPGEAVLTTSGVGIVAAAKLNRDQVRSKNKETLQEVVDSQTVSEAQRQAAVDNILLMTENAEKEVAAETLLQAKGFTDVIVSITENSVDVVVNAGELTDARLAQIEDIVKRKTGSEGKNIVITPVTEQQ